MVFSLVEVTVHLWEPSAAQAAALVGGTGTAWATQRIRRMARDAITRATRSEGGTASAIQLVSPTALATGIRRSVASAESGIIAGARERARQTIAPFLRLGR